jgi:hypothetical protein
MDVLLTAFLNAVSNLDLLVSIALVAIVLSVIATWLFLHRAESHLEEEQGEGAHRLDLELWQMNQFRDELSEELD